MDIPLDRYDLATIGATNEGCLVLLPSSKGKPDKVAVGDRDGVVTCFQIGRKGEYSVRGSCCVFAPLALLFVESNQPFYFVISVLLILFVGHLLPEYWGVMFILELTAHFSFFVSPTPSHVHHIFVNHETGGIFDRGETCTCDSNGSEPA